MDVINNNRTASKSSSLYDNPGLACIALQYIKAYQGDCAAVGGANAKKPPEADFAEIFAPNCGVQTSSLSPITGRLLGCETKYVSPSEAFSGILMQKEKSIEIVTDKNHTEVGAAVSGSDGGSPYFWCVLFSNGTSNSSFVLAPTSSFGGRQRGRERSESLAGAARSDPLRTAASPARRRPWSASEAEFP